MVMYTTTQTVTQDQRIKSLFATVEGREAKIIDLRNVRDVDNNYFMVADVLFNGATLPASVPVFKLQKIYAMVEQVIKC